MGAIAGLVLGPLGAILRPLLPYILAGLAAIAGVWFVYRSGYNAGFQKSEVAVLKRKLEIITRDRDKAIEIQTQMAQRAAELRVESEERRKANDELAEQFRLQGEKLAPAERVRAFFSDAERQRLRVSIPIGRRRANPSAR